MSCFPESVYSVYADGELPRGDAHAVEVHLVRCERCRRLVAALREETRGLRSALQERPAQPQAAPSAAARGGDHTFGFLLVALGTAAALAALGSLFDRELPGGGGWLSPSRLFGVNQMVMNVIFLARDRAPGAFEFAMALGALAGLAGIGTFLAGSLLRRVTSSALAVLLLASACLLPARADARVELRRDEEVHVAVDERLDATLVATGDRVVVDGVVAGDLIAFSESVTIRGTVKGSVIASGRLIEISGRVEGPVIAFTEDLRISGRTRTVYAGADRASLERSSRIAEDAFFWSGELTVDGEVGRDLAAFARRTEVSGEIGRDVEVTGDRVVLRREASVGGQLVVHGDERALEVADGAQIGGGTHLSPMPMRIESGFARFADLHFWLLWVLGLAASFLTGLLAFAIFPGLFSGGLPSGRALARSLGLGFAALVLPPLALLVLAATLVGLPLALLGLALYATGVYLASIVVAASLGLAWLEPRGDGLRDFGLPLLVGLVVVSALEQLPWLGGALGLVVLLLGAGLLVERGRAVWVGLRLGRA